MHEDEYCKVTKVVGANLKSKQLLPFGFALQNSVTIAMGDGKKQMPPMHQALNMQR